MPECQSCLLAVPGKEPDRKRLNIPLSIRLFFALEEIVYDVSVPEHSKEAKNALWDAHNAFQSMQGFKKTGKDKRKKLTEHRGDGIIKL